LLVGKALPPGAYDVAWNGKNDAGQPAAAGVYLLVMRVDAYSQTRKLALLNDSENPSYPLFKPTNKEVIMKCRSSFPARTARVCAAIGAAALFACFLTYGSLTGSDFPRGMYGCPYTNDNSPWQQFDSLRANLAFVTRSWKGSGGGYHALGGAALDSFLSDLGRHQLQVVLEKGDWKAVPGFADSLPYWVQYYAFGQYNDLQVEWDSAASAANLYNSKGESYYYFKRDEGASVSENFPLGGSSLYCKKDSCRNTLGPDIVAKGIYETITGYQLFEPRLDFFPGGSYNPDGMFGYYRTGRALVNRIRVAINNSGALHDTVTVLRYDMVTKDTLGSAAHHYLNLRKMDFDYDLQFKTFSIEAEVPPSYRNTEYFVYTTNQCDVYIDRIEYMDKEQSYPLFWSDATRQTALDSVEAECERLLGLADSYGAQIRGWVTFDGIVRETMPIVKSIAVLNDSLFARDDSLVGNWPRSFVCMNLNEDSRLWYYFDKSHARITDPYMYPFFAGNSLGSQVELDSLAAHVEEAYQRTTATDGEMVFMLQAHDYHSLSEDDPHLRYPEYPEIIAEAFIALAHGARGITFFKYQTNGPDQSAASHGLVNANFEHPAGPPYYYDERWRAVRDVFTQLDSVGDVLLTLQRDTAYCAFGRTDFPGFVDSIYCEDDPAGQSYIEVGQFHNAHNDTFLIVVNRRTDGDRHISIKPDSGVSGVVLRDLYTEERFILTDGKFHSIPFASGAGRIFALERIE
jgi:hypothetical protein